jgi:glutamate synthase (NADPH/NADH) large chain
LSVFYPGDERFVSQVAIFHQRYSLTCFPQWWLAQPFQALAHNGGCYDSRQQELDARASTWRGTTFGDSSDDINR